PVLNDRLDAASVQNRLPEARPAGDVQVGESRAVRLDLLVDGVRAVQVADGGAGVDGAHIFAGHLVEPLGRGVVRVARVRHRAVAGDGDDELVHRLLQPDGGQV